MTFEEWFYNDPYDSYGVTRKDVVFYATDDKPKMSHDAIVALLKEAWNYEDKDASI
jgi:hypothetical protein